MVFSTKVLFHLLLFIWNVEGDIDVSTSFTNDTNVTSGSHSESDEGELPCCKIGDCVFYSLVDALNKATSNDIINITSHVVVLSSIVTIEGLDNITIIGHVNSTTVQCNDVGTVKFVDCNNVTMEGFNWERCGSKNKSAIGVYKSSGVVFENCLFLYSKGQVVVLSNVSGIVYIKNCHFTHNNKHRGQGATIHLSSTAHSMIVIDNNSFESNGPANSIVYIGALNNKYPSHKYLQNSKFVNNRGVSIYVSHTSLHLNGSVWFKGNEANTGGGIYSTSSIITFDDNCNVIFSDNSAVYNSGAIYQINSEVFFSGNSKVTFTNNSAVSEYGGAIYSQTMSFISFTDGVTVAFINNFAFIGAGGIFSSALSNISFDSNSKVHFNNNSAEQYGGAMMLFGNASVSFGGSSIITFNNNTAQYGGAITWYKTTASFGGKSTVTFDHNIAGKDGGAMYCVINSNISFHGNSTARFYNNIAVQHGGAVHNRDYSNVMYYGNSYVSFTNNTAKYGGAIHSHANSRVSFEDFSTITFTQNTANGNGGALGMYNK